MSAASSKSERAAGRIRILIDSDSGAGFSRPPSFRTRFHRSKLIAVFFLECPRARTGKAILRVVETGRPKFVPSGEVFCSTDIPSRGISALLIFTANDWSIHSNTEPVKAKSWRRVKRRSLESVWWIVVGLLAVLLIAPLRIESLGD